MAMTGGTSKLVHTGYGNYGQANFPIKLYVYYKTSQSVANNQSTVTCGMYVTTPGSSWDIGSWSKSGDSYVGTTSNTFSGAIPNFSGTYWIAENKTFTVDHDDDGTGSATIYWKWGVNSPWGQTVRPSGSFSISLPTIARASEPTLSASSVKMGNTLTITTNRKSSDFTHTLKYTFGGTTATIATDVGASYKWTVPDLASKCDNTTSGTATITCITYNGDTKIGTKTETVTLTVPSASSPTISSSSVTMGKALTIKTNRDSSNFTHTLTYSFNGATGTIGTGVTSSKSWTVPLTLAKQIKEDTEGAGTITCVTYNGTAKVGTDTVAFTALVPDNETTQPAISKMALAPTGDLPSAFNGLYIQGKTGVSATFTASSDYSTIKSYRMTVESRNYSGNPSTSRILLNSGSKTVTGRVTDARGYYSTVEKQITVIPYSAPTVTPYTGEKNIICTRCTSDGTVSESGMYLKIKAGRSYHKVVSGGTQKNFCKLGYRYMVEGGKYSDDVILLDEDDTANEVDLKISGVVESLTTYYMVQVFVTDTMGEAETHTFIISAMGCVAHFSEGGYRIGLGRYARDTKENGIDVGWSMNFDKDAQIFGGYVDSLKMGEEIVATSDARVTLNDYKNPGNYYSASADNSQYIDDSPYTGGGFGLTVREVQSSSVVSQSLFFGQTNWLRHWNGEEWSGWIRYLMTSEEESYTVDYVIEEGEYVTNYGTWNYKKWKSGDYQMYGYFTVTTTIAGVAYGSVYYSEQFALPTPFEISSAVVSGSALSWFFPISGGQASTDASNNVGFRLLRPTEFDTGVEISVRLNVVGKMK